MDGQAIFRVTSMAKMTSSGWRGALVLSVGDLTSLSCTWRQDSEMIARSLLAYVYVVEETRVVPTPNRSFIIPEKVSSAEVNDG